MSGFTESGFERKLAELNSTQVSIQTLSLWLLHHRKHFNSIVKIWYKEFLKAQEHRKLTFIYLANDVIQNSKKKGAEYGKGFAPVLQKALQYMARNPEDKTKKSLLRILKIWEDRGIYESPLIKEFESSYRKTWDDLHGPDVDELLEEAIENPKSSVNKQSTSKHHKSSKSGKPISSSSSSSRKDKDREGRKRHHHHHHHGGIPATTAGTSSTGTDGVAATANEDATDASTLLSPSAAAAAASTAEAGESIFKPDDDEGDSGSRREKKRSRSKGFENLRKRAMMEDDMNTIQEWEVDGVSQMEIKLSPSPYKDPPTEEELLACIKSLDKMPSTDATTRGRIANLPPEVSDAQGVDTLCIDSDVSRDLQNKIKAALELLKTYNGKLDTELEDRKRVSMKLQDLIYFQKDLLTQAEHRLEEHQQYGKILSKKLEEMKAHVQSMPDLSKLPSVTDGLAPLPSAGDLFNI